MSVLYPKVLNIKKDKITHNDINIMRPNKYGNPFIIGKDGDRNEVINKYIKYIDERIKSDSLFLNELKADLYGKNLICCCKPLSCHGDYLIRIANDYEF